jgi:K+-sensing histidine kinase KdpD
LIIKAALLRDEIAGRLFVIHVAKDEWNFLDNAKEGEALEYLFAISKSVGANLTVLKSNDIVKTIADFVAENKINCIVMGESPNDHQENNFYSQLKKVLKNVEIYVVP